MNPSHEVQPVRDGNGHAAPKPEDDRFWELALELEARGYGHVTVHGFRSTDLGDPSISSRRSKSFMPKTWERSFNSRSRSPASLVQSVIASSPRF